MMQATLDEQTAAEFERLRPYLLRVAYSHLGSLGEAEDVVQEAWLRLVGAERGEIRNLRAWLTTVVGRLALDALTSARAPRALCRTVAARAADRSDSDRSGSGRTCRSRRVGQHGAVDRP